MLYVQAAPNDTDGSYHIQVSGPQFPKGYASGDLSLDLDDRPCFIPSMRGSARLYFQLTDEEVGDNLDEIIDALHAPSPAYNTDAASAVASRVDASMQIAAQGPPKPAQAELGASSPDVDEVLVTKIVKAVLAALKNQ